MIGVWCTEGPIYVDKDGSYYGITINNSIIKRYLEYMDKIYILTRIREIRPEIKNATKIESFDVEIETKTIENNGMHSFIINTNLPDETELMLTLSDKFSDYIGQTNVTIKNGTATSEEFSSNGNPLSGKYTLTVSMSIPSLQTDNVRAIIGEKGEYITGKYVINDEITNSNYVSAEFELAI